MLWGVLHVTYRLELVDVDLGGGDYVRRLLIIDERRGVCVDVPEPAASIVAAILEDHGNDVDVA